MQWWISNKYALYERMNVKVKAYHIYVLEFFISQDMVTNILW